MGTPDIVKDIFSRLKPPRTLGELASFQRLSAIVELRNHVAHYFPEFRKPGTWPERLLPYIQNGTLRPVGDDTMDWTSRLLVGDVAVHVVSYATEFMREFAASAWRAA